MAIVLRYSYELTVHPRPGRRANRSSEQKRRPCFPGATIQSQRTKGKEQLMGATNINRWIGAGLLGLPLYGALTFWSSMNPQPDPNTNLEAWSRFVTTEHYVLSHLFGSIFGIVFAILGSIALGAYLATSHAGRLGLTGMAITVFGSALFLTVGGVSTFAVPEEGQAVLAGVEEFESLPTIFANILFMATFGVSTVLLFLGNLLLGVAAWRSGRLPGWSGALLGAAALFMYPLGLLYAMLIPSATQSTPPTVLVGALLIVAGGAWMAYSILRRPSVEAASVMAQPRVQ